MVSLKNFRGDIQILSDSAQANTARSQKNKFSKIQNWLTLHGVRLRAGKHCAESLIKISENTKAANTLRRISL